MTLPLSSPVELCLDALEAYFRMKMPELKSIIHDFPTPNIALDYPTLSITHSADDGCYNSMEPYEDSTTDPVDGRFITTWVVGQWDFKIYLDFWCRSEPERSRIYSKAHALLSPQIQPGGLRLQLPGYQGVWSSYDITGFKHEDGEQAAQRGEWRTIVTLLATASHLAEEKVFPMTTIESTLEISDNEATLLI